MTRSDWVKALMIEDFPTFGFLFAATLYARYRVDNQGDRRVLPGDVDAHIDLQRYRPNPVFGAIRDAGQVSDEEMLRTFNLGVGLEVHNLAGPQYPRAEDTVTI